MFAWILKTKPLKASAIGSIFPPLLACGDGLGASSQNVSRNGARPKLFIALPKNIGDTSPASKRSRSNVSPAASSRSASSRNRE